MMDFDQGFSGPVDWNFPSPNATPTHHSFGHDILQTPKTTTLPSHFQDAFTTPQMPSYTTPRLRNAVTTPLQQQQQLVLQQQQQQQQQQHQQQQLLQQHRYHHHHIASQPYTHEMLPPHMSPQWSAQFPAQQVLPSNAQIQTPPPTRDSEARKQVYHQPVAFGTPSTIATRRYMTPQRQEVVSAAGQEHALQIQFPHITQPFENTGPATAPAISSSAAFWDTRPSPPGTRQSATLDDPFMSQMPADLAWSLSHDQASSPGASGATLQQQLLQSFGQSMASSNAESTFNRAMTGSVNPSLVYSSPVHLVPSSRPARVAMPGSQSEQRRRVSANAKHSRQDTSSSGESIQARSATTLRRSNTTGSARPTSALPLVSTDIFGRIQDTQPPRVASPLKRAGRTPLGSISELSKQRHRSSVILTIDESGLARTETRDNSPTRSMRARYPGLFDSDSSDAESDNGSTGSAGKSASFAFSRRDERKQKAAKLDPPTEKFEGLSIPRSASSSSMRNTVTPSRAAVAAAAQLRRQGSLRRSGSLRQSQSRPRLAAPIDISPMNAPEEQQSWPAELSPEKQHFEVNVRRQRPPRAAMQNTLDAHNRRWSMMSVEQHGQPLTDLFAVSHKKMRCVCGRSDDQGQNTIQCMLCTQWSHVACVGLEKAIAPTGFTCLLCTRPDM